MSILTEQPALFTVQPAAIPAGPRPTRQSQATRGVPQYVEIAPGTWAMYVLGTITKLGFEGVDFPHYWGSPQESPRWRVARHGDVPDGTFIFATEAEARAVIAEAYGEHAGGDLRQFMGWIEIPSDDLRRAATDSAPKPVGGFS